MLRRLFLPGLPALALILSAVSLSPAPVSAYDIRTEVPPITEDRWLLPPPPLPNRYATTRFDYLQFIARTYLTQRDYYWGHAGDPQVGYQDNAARREAFWYQVTGDESYAARAMTFIRGHYGWLTTGAGADRAVGFEVICPAIETYLWIKHSPSLTPDDHAFIHSWFNLLEDRNAGYEVGAMNRALGWATGRMILTKLYPQDPRNPARRSYALQVWNDWWATRDTEENSDNYNAIFMTYVAFWLQVMGEENKYWDPALKKLVYRFLAQVSPTGVIPYYGDCCGWNEDAGTWIALFEKWANIYGDGRFKFAAHRMFQWTVAGEEQMWQWGNLNFFVMDALMTAYLTADDRLKEVAPTDIGSLVTTRKVAQLCSREVYDATGYWAHLVNKDTADKILFRNGWGVGASFAQINLVPPWGHGHTDAAGIVSYVSKGSVLLQDTPYLVKDHAYHNCFVVKPNPLPSPDRWNQQSFQTMQATVKNWQAWPEMAYAQIQVTNYMGTPVQLDRRVWFLGDAGLWVQDTAVTTQVYNGLVGPAWQTLATYGVSGPNWFNTCYQSLPVAYIWELRYMMQWNNRPWDLLVYFLNPPSGALIATDDVTFDTTRGVVNQDLMNNSKLRLWCRREGPLTPGQPVRFNTLLLPHAPTNDATPLANSIKLLTNAGQAQIIRMNGGPNVTIWAGMNDGGLRRVNSDIETDAARFVVKKGPGTKVHWWVVQATYLKWKGTTLFSAAKRTTTCSG